MAFVHLVQCIIEQYLQLPQKLSHVSALHTGNDCSRCSTLWTSGLLFHDVPYYLSSFGHIVHLDHPAAQICHCDRDILGLWLFFHYRRLLSKPHSTVIRQSLYKPAGNGPLIQTIQPFWMFRATSYRTHAAFFLNDHHPALNGLCSKIKKSVPSTVTFAVLPLSFRNRFCHLI